MARWLSFAVVTLSRLIKFTSDQETIQNDRSWASTYFVGLQIPQQRYAAALLADSGIADCNLANLPMLENLPLSKLQCNFICCPCRCSTVSESRREIRFSHSISAGYFLYVNMVSRYSTHRPGHHQLQSAVPQSGVRYSLSLLWCKLGRWSWGSQVYNMLCVLS